jgi:hypothetical protein
VRPSVPRWVWRIATRLPRHFWDLKGEVDVAFERSQSAKTSHEKLQSSKKVDSRKGGPRGVHVATKKFVHNGIVGGGSRCPAGSHYHGLIVHHACARLHQASYRSRWLLLCFLFAHPLSKAHGGPNSNVLSLGRRSALAVDRQQLVPEPA